MKNKRPSDCAALYGLADLIDRLKLCGRGKHELDAKFWDFCVQCQCGAEYRWSGCDLAKWLRGKR